MPDTEPLTSTGGRASASLPKAPTGIAGFDDITDGGLPRGRTTLVCGAAGSGKTLFAVEFLARGALQFKEPGVMLAFEESGTDITANVASLGFDLADLTGRRLLAIDHVAVRSTNTVETGDFSLDGIFLRLEAAIAATHARRVVLDGLEALFQAMGNERTVRSEIRRLFDWLKEKGVTAVITAERGDGQLTRHGFEEYVSDCVVLLDHRVVSQVATRRLRIVKYRGSAHSTDEVPFIVTERGLSVIPISAIGLDHAVSGERISSGVARLDAMLGGKGYFRGSSVLVSGSAGTGKTSLAGHLVDAACRRGEKALYFQFEESPAQLVRNLRSIGLDLQPWIDQGLLTLAATRPTMHGMESHLLRMQQIIQDMAPTVVVLDPVTNFLAVGTPGETRALLTRLVDFAKSRGITLLLTSLVHGSESDEQSDAGISSLMDTWLLVREVEGNGERNRVLFVLKSRGMAHSNQVREFVLTGNGILLVDAYVGPSGVFTGSARRAQEARELADEVAHLADIDRRMHEMERRRRSLEAEITGLREQLAAMTQEETLALQVEQARLAARRAERTAMATARQADDAESTQPQTTGQQADQASGVRPDSAG